MSDETVRPINEPPLKFAELQIEIVVEKATRDLGFFGRVLGFAASGGALYGLLRGR